eukprot:1310774-Heterocapsa_arctica.AAC.1
MDGAGDVRGLRLSRRPVVQALPLVVGVRPELVEVVLVLVLVGLIGLVVHAGLHHVLGHAEL